jgi:hypothetical protein
MSKTRHSERKMRRMVLVAAVMVLFAEGTRALVTPNNSQHGRLVGGVSSLSSSSSNNQRKNDATTTQDMARMSSILPPSTERTSTATTTSNTSRRSGPLSSSSSLRPKSAEKQQLQQEEASRQKNVPTPNNKSQAATSTNLAVGEERTLPEMIPRLSDLYHTSTSTATSASSSSSSSDTRTNKNNNNKSKNIKPAGQTTRTKPQKPRPTTNNKVSSSTIASNPKTKTNNEPYKASFGASIRTQGRIKKEFQLVQHGESPNRKAKRILQALLSTPPTHINAANVIGALTFSAKALGRNRLITQDEELRTMLLDTLAILHTLVLDHTTVNEHEEEKPRLLSTRQLCNACWAIAKHYDRDPSLLPPPPEAISKSSETAFGTAERWDILDDEPPGGHNNKEYKLQAQQQRVDETIDEIAYQLTLILDESETFSAKDTTTTEEPEQRKKARPQPVQAKVGEICMATWAYGKLRPRSIPPGWEIPPQLGQLPNAKNEAEKFVRTTSMITFEQQWGSFGETSKTDKKRSNNVEDDEDSLFSSESITGQLFDAVGASLCRSPAAMGITVADDTTNYDDDDDTNIYAGSCLETCSWSELANVAWSFASHGRCKSRESQTLLQGIAREASYRLKVGGKAMQDFLIRDIAQLLWALGTLQADNFRLADDLVVLVESLSTYLRLGEKAPSFGRGRRLARWSCADLVQVALSLAHARIDELNLLRAIYEESHHRVLEEAHNDFNDQDGRRSFRPWEVSILLWAQARLYLKEEQGSQFEEFAADAPKFFLSSLARNRQTLAERGIGAQEQANIVWSLTVLEHHQSQDSIELINRIFHEAADACENQHTIQLEHAHQLWQAYFLLEEESPESVANVPTWFANYLRDKWTIEKARGKLSSARHKSLSQTLNLMGVRHFNEHDEDIDVAIVLKADASWTHETDSEEDSPSGQVSVAVEFDGPNHFTREKDEIDKSIHPRALGHTVLKYRLLKKQGWCVVRVPYFEFDRIPFWASMVSQFNPLLV